MGDRKVDIGGIPKEFCIPVLIMKVKLRIHTSNLPGSVAIKLGLEG